MARCREMEVGELATFIRDSLKKMHDPAPSQDRPNNYEDFLAVWRLMRKKSGDIPPSPSPKIDPLYRAYAKRMRTAALLDDESSNNSKLSKKDRHQVRRTLDRLNREIEKMESSDEYNRLQVSHPATLRANASYTASAVFEDIERAFKHLPKGKRRLLQWRPGRSGSLSVSSIRTYCEERRRRDPEFKYDMDRIVKAYELNPDDPPWEGPDGFDGYVIFTFPGTKKALMECPEIGNAAYVIQKDWETWSQMDKQELMAEAERGGEVARILHQGNTWPAQIKRALGLG
jgi:hypothetical protein